MKILIVDDDPLVLTLLQRVIISQFGFEVVSASNGLEGMEQLDKNNVDMILLDISMPVMDGVEMLESIRYNGKYYKLPVVIMSAIEEKGVIMNLLKLGITEYLLKPLVVDKLKDRLDFIFKKVTLQIMTENEQHDKRTKEPFLFINSDENYTMQVLEEIRKDYNILVAKNGVEGINLYNKNKTRVVFICEGLNLINERLVAKKIKEAAGKNQIKIIFCTTKLHSDEVELRLFDVLFKKNYNPSSTLVEFKKIIKDDFQKEDEVINEVARIVKSDTLLITNQAISLMTGKLIIPQKELPADRYSYIINTELVDKDKNFILNIAIQTNTVSYNKFNTFVKENFPNFSGTTNIPIYDMLFTVAGRIKALLEHSGMLVGRSICEVKPKIKGTTLFEFPFTVFGDDIFKISVNIEKDL